jgi:putative SOS response-associated peptidase YedK
MAMRRASSASANLRRLTRLVLSSAKLRSFGLGGLWENWKDPTSGEWIRTFAIITTDANEMVAEIHDRMPLIIAPGDYKRWLSDEPDPHELMRSYRAGPMRIWPISTRVKKPGNDDASILEPIELSAA